MDHRSEKHFVLVHGACHGAWCWYKVATLLRSAGHRVTALDMAASGAHPKRVDELRSIADYFQPLMEFMESLQADDRVALVGHSMGGMCISAAMERYPEKISVTVFVTGFMYSPDVTISALFQKYCEGKSESWMDCKRSFDKGLDKPPTSLLFGPNFTQSILYNRSPPEDFTLATMLLRPCPIGLDEAESVKHTILTEKNYGSVRRVYVVIEGDKSITENLQRWMIDNNPPNEVRVISGADHMVMFSKPQELSSCLLNVVEKVNCE